MTATNGSAMTRRGVLASAGGGASVVALGSAPAPAQTGAPKTFVLVHGAWHGGWCWRRVADLLQKRGHKVFTPTLTGVGERSHLVSKDIVLDTHITDIVNVIKWEDLNEMKKTELSRKMLGIRPPRPSAGNGSGLQAKSCGCGGRRRPPRSCAGPMVIACCC